MSVLTPDLQSAIGIMKPLGFFKIQPLGNKHFHNVWCCDSFTVEGAEGIVENEKHYSFKVVFNSLTGEKVIEWDFNSLYHLSRCNELTRVLLENGIRVSPDPQAAIAILSAIQNPNLILRS